MNRAAAAVIGVCVVLGLAAAARGYQRQEDTIAAIEREAEVRQASSCVSAWTVREDIRDGIDRAASAGAEALITVVPDADPAVVDAYRTAIEDQATAARGEVPDPECSLDAARAVLDE